MQNSYLCFTMNTSQYTILGQILTVFIAMINKLIFFSLFSLKQEMTLSDGLISEAVELSVPSLYLSCYITASSAKIDSWHDQSLSDLMP